MLPPIMFEVFLYHFAKQFICTVTFLIIQNITVEKIYFNWIDYKSLKLADMMLLVHPWQEQLGMLFVVLTHS